MITEFYSKRTALLILSIAVILFFLFSPGTTTLKEYQETQILLGTIITIHCFYDETIDISPIIQKCWERVKEIQSLMSAHSDAGDIARINESGIDGVQVNKDVYNLIRDSIEFSQLTKGTFDITVFPLSALWKNSEKKGQLPDDISLLNAKEKIGYKYIKLKKPATILLKKKGMKLDLGAIAKGYAVDEIALRLSQGKIRNFMIDAGGDIYCKGRNREKKKWKIGVQDPQNSMIILDVLKLSNVAVTTSGNYERFYRIGEETFSHIIDPSTGYPQKSVLSATVIAPTAKEADALSTALSVMGAKKGIKFINSLNNIEAMVIENMDGKIETHHTKGYRKYL